MSFATAARYEDMFTRFEQWFNEPADVGRTLAQLEKLSVWLDSSITLPGTNYKIGWDTIVGLIPGIGDAISAALSTWIVIQAKRLGASNWVLARMIGNVAMDSLVGSVPLAGDVFDAMYKANNMNIALLKKHLDKKGVRSSATVVDAPYAKARVVS